MQGSGSFREASDTSSIHCCFSKPVYQSDAEGRVWCHWWRVRASGSDPVWEFTQPCSPFGPSRIGSLSSRINPLVFFIPCSLLKKQLFHGSCPAPFVTALCPRAPHRAKIAPRVAPSTFDGVLRPVLRRGPAPPQSLAVDTSPAPKLPSDDFDTPWKRSKKRPNKRRP